MLTPDVHVEALDGELLVTRLRQSVLPVIRYRTGDRGAVTRAECPCGHTGASILDLEGRHRCTFNAPSGEAVDAWSLAPLFKHHPLHAFRLTQTATSHFELRLSGARDVDELRHRLLETLARLGWDHPQLVVSTARPGELDTPKPRPFGRAHAHAQST